MAFTTSEINLTFCELLKNYGWINSDKNNNAHFSVADGKGIIEFIYKDMEFGVNFDLKDAQNCTNKKQLQRLLINSFVDQTGSYCDYLIKCTVLEMRDLNSCTFLLILMNLLDNAEYYNRWINIKDEEQIKLEDRVPYLAYKVAVMERDVYEYHLYDD